MPRTKKTTTVEETEEAPVEPVVSEAQRLSDERASKFLGEPVVNNEVVEPEVKEVKEEVKEEVKPEVKEETETVEFDPEQLKREAAAEARAEILKALTGTTEEKTQENVDEYQKFRQEFFDKEGKQPDWVDVSKFIKDQAKAELKAEQEAATKAEQDKQEEQKKTLEQQNEATNKYVEDTLNELYTSNKLPRITDKENKDDYGLRARNALFDTIIKVNNERIAKQLPPKTVKEIFYEDYKLPNRQVAGFDAPVNMGRGGYTPDAETEQIDYVRDLKGKSFRDIFNPFKR